MRWRRAGSARPCSSGSRTSTGFQFDRMVGTSPAIREVVALARKVAQGEATSVLVQGESGTGKDVLAKAVHWGSARAEEPFMEIACTAMPDASRVRAVQPREGGLYRRQGPEEGARRAKGKVVVVTFWATWCLPCRGNQVFMTFRPDFAIRMLKANVEAGFEAPMRIYLSENADGTATVTYIRPSALFKPYGSRELDALGIELDAVFEKIVAQALEPR